MPFEKLWKNQQKMLSLFWQQLNYIKFQLLSFHVFNVLEFKAIKTKAIKEHLADILKKKASALMKKLLSLIARRAEGGMRDALSILDQALSLTNDNDVSLGNS